MKKIKKFIIPLLLVICLINVQAIFTGNSKKEVIISENSVKAALNFVMLFNTTTSCYYCANRDYYSCAVSQQCCCHWGGCDDACMGST